MQLGNIKPFSKDLLKLEKVQAIKVLEESAECVEAWKDWYKHGRTAIQYRAFLDEAADVAQSLSNLLAASGVMQSEWEDAVKRCQSRNGERGRFDDWTESEFEQYQALKDHDKA